MADGIITMKPKTKKKDSATEFCRWLLFNGHEIWRRELNTIKCYSVVKMLRIWRTEK